MKMCFCITLTIIRSNGVINSVQNPSHRPRNGVLYNI